MHASTTAKVSIAFRSCISTLMSAPVSLYAMACARRLLSPCRLTQKMRAGGAHLFGYFLRPRLVIFIQETLFSTSIGPWLVAIALTGPGNSPIFFKALFMLLALGRMRRL